jgi:hypothetical protein
LCPHVDAGESTFAPLCRRRCPSPPCGADSWFGKIVIMVGYFSEQEDTFLVLSISPCCTKTIIKEDGSGSLKSRSRGGIYMVDVCTTSGAGGAVAPGGPRTTGSGMHVG